MQEGKRIYVESLLSDKEYAECAKKYPKTYVNGPVKVPFFESENPWRYRMGERVTPEEVAKSNKVWNDILKNVTRHPQALNKN